LRSAGDRPVLRLAATLGDPTGIGPEVVSRAARIFAEESPDVEVVLIGSTEALETHAHGLPAESIGVLDGSRVSAGRLSLLALRRAVDLALGGQVAGIVTGPVRKPSLRAGGSPHPGQTELLAELTGTDRVGMLMHAEDSLAGVPIRILLATTHLPFREVPNALTPERLEDQTRLLDVSLRTRWGMDSPRIALCALNPHASDEGLFGDEEARIFAPVVHRLRGSGINVTEALPADTVFLRMLSGDVDAVVSPYHDVGMAVFKTLTFGRGVNVTLGLPFVRTSPDHGTATGLVGTGRADPTSTVAALRLAARLAAGDPAAL
jgi:4-hydroxythreonine-4-phosphate dehydrogenase